MRAVIGEPLADQARLLGFVIKDSSMEPGEFIPISPGVTVLYGLNGAGKTRILRDVERFWRGHRSNALALVQLPARLTGSVDWYRDSGRVEWARDWDDPLQPRRDEEDDPEAILLDWAWRCFRSETADSEAPEFLKTLDPHRDEGLWSEWQQTRLIWVEAHGSEERPEWFSAPAVVTGSACPFSNEAAALWETFSNRDDDLLADYWYTLNAAPYATTSEGHTVLAGAVLGAPALEFLTGSAGRHDRLIDMQPRMHARATDVNDVTRKHLRQAVKRQVEVRDAGPVASEELSASVSELERVANEHFQRSLVDAPTLGLAVEVVGLDAGVEWFVEDDAGSPSDRGSPWRRREFAALSRAQSTWASWSIEEALSSLQQDGKVDRLILLDEPEAALHRSAESQVARYLSEIGTAGDVSLLVATHSPELLDFEDARLFEVERHDGRRRLKPLPAIARNSLSELGLLPSDLLRRQRGILLVEGAHDQAVLEVLFGDEMRRLRVEVLPLRGTHQLSAARIGFLFEYTSAHIFVMLDNIKTDAISETWRTALLHADAGDVAAALVTLDQAECLTGDSEGRVMRELLQHVVNSGTDDRLTPHGLTKADIIEYLPVAELVPGHAEDWASLRRCHLRDRQADKNTPKDFKRWLGSRFGADLSTESVARAAQTMDTVPPDLLRLLKTVEANALGSGRPR